MRAPLLLASLLVACAGAPASTSPQAPSELPPPPTSLDPGAIDAYIAAQVKAREIVGAALVVMREGEIVLARGYGVASQATRAPVTPDTPFAIGSITKQFVCAAAFLLADDGALSIDDKVSAHYPELTRAADITLEDLGSHLSGYPDYYPLDFVDRRMRRPTTPDQIIRSHATGALDFEPRTRYSYSNTGFIVLGRVIEKVSGMPLGDFLERRVFEPLGMATAAFAPEAGAPGLAAGHNSFALGAPEPIAPEGDGWLHAAAGIYTSAADLARWNLALSQGKLLSPTSFARLTTARTLAGGRGTDYGCGIGVRRVAGETVLSHSGAVSGFLAYNAWIPRTRSAVVLLVNTEGGSPGELVQPLVALLVGPATQAPVVRGAPAREVALDLFHQMQRGAIDRSLVSPELSAYLGEERLRAAAPRLRALGEPTAVEAVDARERGGMEVHNVRFHFADRVVKALLYRTPDGKVHEFLLLHD